MPRGGSGGGGEIPGGEATIFTEEKEFTVPADRLVSGLLTVNVRNMNDTDVNMEYAKNWRLNPNNIPDNDGETPEFPPEGTYPFYADEDYDAVDKTPPSYPTPTIFWDGSDGDDNSGRQYLEVDEATIGVHQTRVTCVAESGGNLTSKWFTVYAYESGAGGTAKVLVWISVGGSSVPDADGDSNLTFDEIVPVLILASDSATAVALKIATYCNLSDAFGTCTSSTNTATLIDTENMYRPVAVNGNTPFTIDTGFYGTAVGWNKGSDQCAQNGGEGTAPYKELGIGDYDCFLFYVVLAGHIHANTGTPSSGAVKYTRGGNTVHYHHDACQSFIKSHLISRINNASNCDNFSGESTHDLNHSGFKQGATRNKYTTSESGSRGQATLAQEYVFSNGLYVHSGHVNQVTGASSQFGIDLADLHDDGDFPAGGISSNTGNNTFFTPVHSIEIGTSHGSGINNSDGGDWNGLLHPTTMDLNVKVHMYAFKTGVGEDPTGYVQSRANILWQPWGETATVSDP